MTPSRLHNLCLIWQDRLKLTDWTVTTELHPPPEMEGESGHNDWCLDDRSSAIKIDRKQKAYDIQRVLVHELVHLIVARWPTAVYNDPHLEAAVWGITDAFLVAYGVFPRAARAKAHRIPAAAARRRLRIAA